MVDQICENTTGYERATNGKYYKHHGIALGVFADAQAICASEGGNLANVFGINWIATEPYRLRVLRGPNPAVMRVGGNSNADRTAWILPDGSQAAPLQASGVDWGQYQPGTVSLEKCLCYHASSFILLNDIICSSSPGQYDSFLCEILLP